MIVIIFPLSMFFFDYNESVFFRVIDFKFGQLLCSRHNPRYSDDCFCFFGWIERPVGFDWDSPRGLYPKRVFVLKFFVTPVILRSVIF